MTFNRFDIIEAHKLIEDLYHIGGILIERKSNTRRNMSTGYQLYRMGYNGGLYVGYELLSDNGKAIFHNLQARYGFTVEPIL